MKIKKISILGLGYIGLPLAIILADKSNKIYGFDNNPKVLKNIKNLKIKIKEKDLITKFKSKKVQKNFEVSNQVIKSDVYIIAVPTPFNKEKLIPDISAVKSSVDKIIHLLDPGNLIIIESTCPVGTTEKMMDLILVIIHCFGVIGQHFQMVFMSKKNKIILHLRVQKI